MSNGYPPNFPDVGATVSLALAAIPKNPQVQSAKDIERMRTLQMQAAELLHRRLVKEILEFEALLGSSDEVGAILVSGGDGQAFHVRNLRFSNPDLIIFEGVSSAEQPVRLCQHVTQTNIKLVGLKVESAQPTRLGFLAQALKS